jgi:hypothetical protein
MVPVNINGVRSRNTRQNVSNSILFLTMKLLSKFCTCTLYNFFFASSCQYSMITRRNTKNAGAGMMSCCLRAAASCGKAIMGTQSFSSVTKEHRLPYAATSLHRLSRRIKFCQKNTSRPHMYVSLTSTQSMETFLQPRTPCPILLETPFTVNKDNVGVAQSNNAAQNNGNLQMSWSESLES